MVDLDKIDEIAQATTLGRSFAKQAAIDLEKAGMPADCIPDAIQGLADATAALGPRAASGLLEAMIETQRAVSSTVEKCDCGAPGQPKHTCPLQYDVHGDSEYMCNCCETCEQQCNDDI